MKFYCQSMRRTAAPLAAAMVLGAFAAAAQTPEQPAPASGEASPQVDTSAESTAKLLEDAERAVSAQPAPPEDVLKLYGQAKALLENAVADQARNETLRAEIRAAPARLVELKAQLDAAPVTPLEPLPSDAALAEVEQWYAQAQERLGALAQAREAADTSSRELERRIGEIPDEAARAAEILAEARKQNEEPLPADEPVGTAAAEALRRRAAERAAAVALALLNTEREHAGIVVDVARSELALAERRIDPAQKVEQRAAEMLKAKRRERGLELVQRARDLQKAFAGRDPALVALCDANVALAEEASGPDGILAMLRATMDRQREVEAHLAEVQSDYGDIQARLRLMGLTQGVGSLLLEERGRLPLAPVVEEQLAASRQALNEAQLGRLQLRDKSRQAREDGPDQHGALQSMGVVEGEAGWGEARRDVRRILDGRRELLEEITKSYTQYQQVLSETIAVEQEFVATVEEVTDFVEEQVLWVRNMPALSARDLSLATQVVPAMDWKRAASGLAGDLREEFRTHPLRCTAILLAAAMLLIFRFAIRRRIRRLGCQVHEHPPGTFPGTLETLWLTGLWGITWPALIGVAAWLLTATPPDAGSTAHLAQALGNLAFLLVPVCLIRAIALPDGLGAAHLKMDPVRMAAIRKITLVILLSALPLVFVSLAIAAQPSTEARLALGRLLGVGAQLVVAVLAAVAMRREGPLVCGEEGRKKNGFLYRRWWLWYPVVVALPVLLAGASAAGYDYSAVEIGTRINGMALMVLGMFVVRDVILRGLWLFRRDMVRQTLRKSREKEQAAADEDESDFREDMRREDVEHVTSVSTRTANFVRYLLVALLLVGMYVMWEDVLPAFRFLNRIDLYEVGQVQVTLAGLLSAILAAIVAVFAVRTLPGMLDVYVLSRFAMHDGERSALVTLVRYFLVIIGVVNVCSRLGATWDNLHWIVAALGVGLGFGLQEIVANLTSGLLLLLDGRIRPLDVVTVGDTSGRVTSIRALATTVTDWNNREVVMPNKEFISERVINWTLSERTVRLDVPVGIAYGSDTRKAEEILVRVGLENEHTLDDPPVRAVFLGFGPGSLDFQLHAWVNMEDLLKTRHELHRAVDDAFQEAGMVIAFPQLDVHMDSPVEKGE